MASTESYPGDYLLLSFSLYPFLFSTNPLLMYFPLLSFAIYTACRIYYFKGQFSLTPNPRITAMLQ